jgi:hypothetical protein
MANPAMAKSVLKIEETPTDAQVREVESKAVELAQAQTESFMRCSAFQMAPQFTWQVKLAGFQLKPVRHWHWSTADKE